MTKKIAKTSAKIGSIVRNLRHSETLPFPEIPSDNQFNKSTETPSKDLAASDLFSLFTADIIRQDVKFTR